MGRLLRAGDCTIICGSCSKPRGLTIDILTLFAMREEMDATIRRLKACQDAIYAASALWYCLKPSGSASGSERGRAVKKLTFKEKMRQKRRAVRVRRLGRRRNKLAKYEYVDLWHGAEIERAKSTRASIHPPAIMIFEENFEQMTTFFEETRLRLLRTNERSQWIARSGKRKRARIAGYVDFSKIEQMSTAAALVLAAEYERAVQIIGAPPPLVNVDRWQPQVINQLFHLGFFPMLGITEASLEDQLLTEGDVMTLQFLSGSNAEETAKADEMLLQLAAFLDPENALPDELRIPFNSALSEAMVNVRKHAYPEGHDFQYRHVNKWWLAASADKRERSLTVVIYDQGATIPVTYAKMAATDRIRKFVEGVVGSITGKAEKPFAFDGVHIEAAAKFGNSQTGDAHRGKGLPDMLNVIDQCPEGRLVILSRGGQYIYRSGGESSRSAHHRSVGGTLIEWHVRLPENAGD